jgi:hypothetical protein
MPQCDLGFPLPGLTGDVLQVKQPAELNAPCLHVKLCMTPSTSLFMHLLDICQTADFDFDFNRVFKYLSLAGCCSDRQPAAGQ